MVFLDTKELVPGTQALVREVLPFNETITLEAQKQLVTLGFASARYVFVQRT